jgi:hypothetical protein
MTTELIQLSNQPKPADGVIGTTLNGSIAESGTSVTREAVEEAVSRTP